MLFHCEKLSLNWQTVDLPWRTRMIRSWIVKEVLLDIYLCVASYASDASTN